MHRTEAHRTARGGASGQDWAGVEQLPLYGRMIEDFRAFTCVLLSADLLILMSVVD
jgi:hypothetical protein